MIVYLARLSIDDLFGVSVATRLFALRMLLGSNEQTQWAQDGGSSFRL
jgi:hypothetical protein